jgi:hypothetical protein
VKIHALGRFAVPFSPDGAQGIEVHSLEAPAAVVEIADNWRIRTMLLTIPDRAEGMPHDAGSAA